MTLNFLKLDSLLLGRLLLFFHKNQIMQQASKDLVVYNEVQDAILHYWTIRHWFDIIYKSRIALFSLCHRFDATNLSCRNNLALHGSKYITIDSKRNIKTRHAKFMFCLNVQDVTLDAEYVDEDMFYMDISLKTVMLKNTKTICKHAFKNCISLENIYIPHTVEKIEEYAFENCINLKHIYFY